MAELSCLCDTTDVNITIKQCGQIEKELRENIAATAQCGDEEENSLTSLETPPHHSTEFVFQVILILLVGVFGVIGNGGAIYRFSRLKKATKFHHLMMLISMYDTLCILMIVLIFSVPRISIEYKNSAFFNHFAPIALSLTQVALTGSVYTTLAITMGLCQ